MLRALRPAVPFLFLLASVWAAPRAVQGQYVYPRGYGGYGWGGWGGGGGQTAPGSIAQGLGVLAAGRGQFNLETSQAAAINATTAARINEYMYLSQQEANRKYRERVIRQKKLVNETADSLQKRLRDNPTQSDINSGDALNVVLDELNNPKVYVKALSGAKAPVPGDVIREIPFQSAANMVTASVDELTKKGAPPAIKDNPAFDKERQALRQTVAQLRQQQEENGAYNPETLQKLQDQIKVAWDKVEVTLPKNSRELREAEKFLKAAFGLAKMLETPAVDVLLSGVEKHPETTVGDLLNFMKAFNLRFGVASTPTQREIYSNLYPVLTRLRDETLAAIGPVAAETPPNLNTAPGEFFEGMEFKQLPRKNVPPPPQPR